ncbi:MAG: hypothetical protein JXO22_13005 [Phycisphaerae bacterium]|nr:hypothetical protein [Phycisphaerae bacterium]
MRRRRLNLRNCLSATAISEKFAVASVAAMAIVFFLSSCGGVDPESEPATAGNSATQAQAGESGCRFANIEEISEATGLTFTTTEDRQAGCLYDGPDGYIRLVTFPTAQYEQRVERQLKGDTGRPVEGLGVEAIRASPTLFVRTIGSVSFSVLKSGDQSLDDEIAAAKVLLPRIESY